MKPLDLSIRMYNVGHGDCFLLTFRYLKEHRHLLIDFGTLQPNRAEERQRLLPVALDIFKTCEGKLHGVVATHAHRDHIGGFERLRKQEAPGNIVARLQPELVIYPETHPVASALDSIYTALTGSQFSNHRAMEDFRKLGQALKVHYGKKTGLEKVIPGVKFHVLGPVQVTSRLSRSSMRLLDGESRQILEFWATEYLALQQSSSKPIFPHADQLSLEMAPPSSQWLMNRLNRFRDDQLLQFAQMIHTEINNSSVILLIEACGHKLLFPGDAETGSWLQVLNHPVRQKLVSGTTVYKASHHGSINGTPPALLKLFRTDVITLLSSRDPKMQNPLGKHTATLDTRHLISRKGLSLDLHLKPLRNQNLAA